MPNAKFSEKDLEVIHRLANSPDLDDMAADLGRQEAYAEMAWLSGIAEDFDSRFTVCTAIAVASAHGLLEDIRIQVPTSE